MKRLLVCFALCLLLAPEPLPPSLLSDSLDQQAPPAIEVADDGSSLPTTEEMTQLAKTNPIAFLENCLRRYDREVEGYHLLFKKHERVQGKELAPEVIDVHFAEKPTFRVRFDWKQGAGLAQRVLYVEGENNNNLVAKLAGRLLGRLPPVERDVDGPDARQSGRYPITQFGLRAGMNRTLAAWINAREQNALHLEYLGEQKVPELGGRVCWVFQRTGYQTPEEDGITESTIYVDRETWLQTASVLHGAGGSFLAAYYFCDVELNPTFPPGIFTREGLR